MKKIFLSFIVLLVAVKIPAQVSYKKYITDYQEKYVLNHEVVKKEDRKYFRFFPPVADYKIEAQFKKITDTVGFMMPTSGTGPKKFFRYGTLHFTLNGSSFQLTLFQNEQLMSDSVYKDYLFLPFTDLTSGEESYGGGRYIDLEIKDIKNNKIVIDFNKAYNPYCVYSVGYNCPIPPRENDLPMAIKAGERDFAKKLH